MVYQATFKRYEIKYLLTSQQKKEIMLAMKPYMKPDEYGRTVIRNLYFDTDSFRLIRRSLEKPVYKEKLRIRAYQTASDDDPVFVELKKKYKAVVYKRRLALSESQAMNSICFAGPFPVHSQIADEIDYFRSYYRGLHPVVFLSYEREAFYSPNGGDLRVTFDEKILFREEDLSLGSKIYGIPLLEEGQTLMEVKTAGGMPLWMTGALNRLQVFQTSFSKYGLAYRHMMTQQETEELRRNRYVC